MQSNNNNVLKDNVVRFPPSKEQVAIEQLEEECREELLQTLSKLRDNIINGKMDDVIIIARNTENNLFFTQAFIRQSTYKSTEIGAVAATLSSLAADLNDIFTHISCSDIDGNTVEPFVETEGILL